MRFFTPDGGELIEIMNVTPERGRIVIQGKIMGTMPMKAVLTPQQLRQSFKFLTPRLAVTLIGMLFRRSGG
jgi:hypothetical protein